ncbi:MAG TPA: hypothetical protein VFO72_01040 [Pyrinomonadaceae bacterium]|nr:hypothetical protein [Pyrinomonadaceae bacterium]
MFNDPFHPEEAAIQQHDSAKRKLLAGVCAVAITAILLAGYAYIRKYHAQRILANAPPTPEAVAKGPALAHVVIDEPTLEKDLTTVGGVVKNISNQPLSGLSVTLELRRRKDGKTEQALLPVTPAQLQPQEEGAYAAKFSIEDFASVRLTGVHADPESTLIVHTSSQGKKRAPERLQPQVINGRRSGKPGEFINTPNNPGRVP